MSQHIYISHTIFFFHGKQVKEIRCLISSLRHEADGICDCLGYQDAFSGNSLLTFRENTLDCLTLGDGTYKVSKKKSARKYSYTLHNRETAVAQLLKCCATNRKVVGSIPAGVIGIFH